MRYSALLKKLKKNLRRKMKRIALGLAVVALWVAAGLYVMEINQQSVPVWSAPDHEYEVYLKKVDRCGEETTYMGRLDRENMEQLKRDHPEWEHVEADQDRIFFIEHLDDKNMDCENAYFGITSDGYLSLFEGLPKQNKMIRTFYQIDIEHLESSLPHETVRQLYEGIQVRDLNEYNSVLSTFSPYALDSKRAEIKR
jgi:forespore regulator of the sigma-K checkpoint